ncbi:MAG: NAD(P)/FAD-dependent oxidoreductase [Candidatus Saccharicenans sp.]|nr:NAD(P)/FAD-dependent oxidoreductase [Candidatus Saccharicenans sp.]
MRYDVIIVGAGPGGLACGALLAKHGARVLILEKDRHPGGTSYIFQRDGYRFPMGPLSFSYPQYVSGLLNHLGVREGLKFKRNSFQLVVPGMDLVFSSPPDVLKEELERIFPGEKSGLREFFLELERVMELVHEAYLWCPDYLPERMEKSRENLSDTGKTKTRTAELLNLSKIPARDLLRKYFKDRKLINFLGSMGSGEPVMSFLTLTTMWNIMSKVGIWYPEPGIHGICDALLELFKKEGGEYRPGTGVKRILVEKRKATGILLEDGTIVNSEAVVSNADYKTTFLQLVEESALEAGFFRMIEEIPYTGSELCVYLGIDPQGCDFSRMKATHLFFSPFALEPAENLDEFPELASGEMEICRWTDNEPSHAPGGKVSLILRLGMNYERFAKFRTGEKKRTTDYIACKKHLALKLVRIAERIIPGLSQAVELMDVATPLTYQDWGHRYRGSIAGWSWSSEHTRASGRKVLIETPVMNLFMVGIYAVSELFMGGFPTSLRTGELTSRLLLKIST